VLLDAAAFAPTSRLDLSAHHPDFVAVSFYKLFGYPTGIGALLARRSALRRLKRPWFSGGTVTVATVAGARSVPLPGHGRFEDGTVDYLGLPAVEIGLRHIERIGLDMIGQRVEALGSWLLAGLRDLRHGDGSPATRIYGPRVWDRRGPTIAFNFLHPDGRVVDERCVDRAAAAHGISLRTGCFCNPGAGEAAFSLSEAAMVNADFDDRAGIDAYLGRVGMASGGAVRVSLGIVSNIADVCRFLAFAEGFRDLTTIPEDLPPRVSC
jgi:selenocysteine lyase/cysteine desulfurase